MLTRDPPVRPSGAVRRAPTIGPQKPRLERASKPSAPMRLCAWRGASGRIYLHRAYNLLWCPPLPRANVLLVHGACLGPRTVLRAILVEDEAPTLNLAYVRQLGATIGANEVHVYDLAETAEQRAAIESDLRNGLSEDDAASIPL